MLLPESKLYTYNSKAEREHIESVAMILGVYGGTHTILYKTDEKSYPWATCDRMLVLPEPFETLDEAIDHFLLEEEKGNKDA